MSKNIIVFDLDGTLSLVGERIGHLRKTPKDYDAFYDAVGDDIIFREIVTIFRALGLIGYKLNIVTGRRETTRNDTVNWLSENGIWDYTHRLYMRGEDDRRPDTEVKEELVADFMDEILMVFEDRTRMVEWWRSKGITCLQVSEGNF